MRAVDPRRQLQPFAIRRPGTTFLLVGEGFTPRGLGRFAPPADLTGGGKPRPYMRIQNNQSANSRSVRQSLTDRRYRRTLRRSVSSPFRSCNLPQRAWRPRAPATTDLPHRLWIPGRACAANGMGFAFVSAGCKQASSSRSLPLQGGLGSFATFLAARTGHRCQAAADGKDERRTEVGEANLIPAPD